MSTILVRAAEGRRVRLPDGGVLTDAGEPVPVDPRDLFIARRLAEGDLVEMPAASGGTKEKAPR